jgi:hypothetical protein
MPIFSPSQSALPSPARKVLFLSTGLTLNGIRAAKDLHDAGCLVVFHCSATSLACTLPRVRTIHPRRGLSAEQAILRSLLREDPDFLIPCDDGAVSALHRLHQTHACWRQLIQHSLGSPEFFPAVSSRAGLMRALTGVPDIFLPDWAALRSAADLDRWIDRADSAPSVLKLEGSAGGDGVRIVHTPDEARSAYAQLTRQHGIGGRVSRRLYDLVFNLQRPAPAPAAVLAQRYIKGAPATAAAFCREGEVVACTVFEVLSSSREVTPAATLRRVHHPAALASVRAAARHLGLSGFHGFDFLLQGDSSIPWLLELNPRVTPSAHLPLGQGQDLVAACASQLRPGATVRRPPILQPEISLFPRQIVLDPRSPHLMATYHDIDWTAPEFIRGCLNRIQAKDLYGRCQRYLKRSTWARPGRLHP